MKKNFKNLQIQIAEPCNEKWQEMTPIRGGNFCASCEKTVVDFTEMTDRELINYYQQYNGKLCGRFREDQLNRQIAFPTSPSRLHKWKAIAAVVSGLLLGGEVNAQSEESTVAIHQVDQKPKEIDKAKAMFLDGFVHNEAGEPLAGATIQLFSEEFFQKGFITDENGQFRIQRPDHLDEVILKVGYLGHTEEEIWIGEKEWNSWNWLEVELKSGFNLDEIVFVGERVRISKSVLMGSVGIVVPFEKKKQKKVIEPTIETVPQVEIYPNPFADQINVDISIEEKDRYLFQLYSSTGQLILAETQALEMGKQVVSLAIKRDLPAATYIFVITQNNRNIHAQQIVKTD